MEGGFCKSLTRKLPIILYQGYGPYRERRFHQWFLFQIYRNDESSYGGKSDLHASASYWDYCSSANHFVSNYILNNINDKGVFTPALIRCSMLFSHFKKIYIFFCALHLGTIEFTVANVCLKSRGDNRLYVDLMTCVTVN